MARTPAEHAEAIEATLLNVEAAETAHRKTGRKLRKALLALHTALAEGAAEHGEALGLGEVAVRSAVPKREPPNP
jgi:hypothetical protein